MVMDDFPSNVDVVIRGHKGFEFQELQFVVDGGGPCGMEVVVQAGLGGVSVRVWNPYEHPPEGLHTAWHTVYERSAPEK